MRLASLRGALKDSWIRCTDQKRCLSVAGWGLNDLGQVGEGLAELHPEPCILNHLEGEEITGLAAGDSHSAAVGGGIVWTWGCGTAGKLGHGDSKTIIRPQRLEALCGRAEIVGASLGSDHSIFLDSHGFPFSCGENEQGQSRNELSSHVEAQSSTGEVAVKSHLMPVMSGLDHPVQNQGSFLQERMRLRNAMVPLFPPKSSHMLPRLPFPQMKARREEVESLARLLQEGGQDLDWQAAAYQAVDPRRFQDLPAALNLPLEEGRIPSVTSISASNDLSVLLTTEGSVLFLGASMLEEPHSMRVIKNYLAGLRDTINRMGGAVQVAAGESFCVILTKSGRAILTGQLHPLPGWPAQRLAIISPGGLPPITDIAAGGKHALLSDGCSIWSAGLWKTPSGHTMHDPWDKPGLVTQVSGVHQLTAGKHASAVIDSDHKLHMWGRLLSKAEVAKQENKSWKSKRNAFRWEGLGSDKPCEVSGLGKVHEVALGSKHALVLVDR